MMCLTAVTVKDNLDGFEVMWTSYTCNDSLQILGEVERTDGAEGKRTTRQAHLGFCFQHLILHMI